MLIAKYKPLVVLATCLIFLAAGASAEDEADALKQDCDAGMALACTDLGFLYDSGTGVAQDYARAAELYEQGCDGGNASGCTNLGYLYDIGSGVERDLDRALASEFYQRGCDLGDDTGCERLR